MQFHEAERQVRSTCRYGWERGHRLEQSCHHCHFVILFQQYHFPLQVLEDTCQDLTATVAALEAQLATATQVNRA